MPEHSPIINVRIDACGDHSWNTAYGAYTVPIPIPYGKYLYYLLELVSKELNHLAAILHVYAGA